MQEDMVNQLIKKFNDMVDSLIADFREYNLDEDTLAFLAKKTRNFITFNEITLSNIIFGLLEKVNNAKYNYDDEIKQAKEMIRKIYETINRDIDHILEHEDEEEHSHGHDHDHSHHHIHIDVDEVQGDIDEIIKSLDFLKKIFVDIFDIVQSSLKYEIGHLGDDEYAIKNERFKANIKGLYDEFMKMFIQ